jgi:hypothetical protein
LYFSPSIIIMIKSRRMRVRACSSNGEKRNACRILVRKPEGKRPLGRPRLRCKFYIVATRTSTKHIQNGTQNNEGSTNSTSEWLEDSVQF